MDKISTLQKLNSTEKKLAFYISLFVTLIFTIFKLFSLRQNAVLPHYWKFNGYELLFQTTWNFLFCLFISLATLKLDKRKYKTAFIKLLFFAFIYILSILIAQVIGLNIQLRFFYDDMPLKILRALYFGRLFTSLVMVAILIRLFKLLDERKFKEKENEQLRNAYLSAQVELLKEQLNPHFFFNTLSSLSAVVREDPKKAQRYIEHLSKIFHYSLDAKNKSLVIVKDELSILQSYIELIKMRFENNVQIKIESDETSAFRTIPHMSLQPLLENAIKHNIATSSNPLYITLSCKNDSVIISNNLQPLQHTESSTGLGLSNLNERYKILMKQEITIQQTSDKFIVTLPLNK